jgi:hypothetical protein
MGVEIEEDEEDKPISRKMKQVWFAHKEQLAYARRFVSDWLLVIDGTFNTNKDRLPLLIAVGVLNSERTFPVAFSSSHTSHLKAGVLHLFLRLYESGMLHF